MKKITPNNNKPPESHIKLNNRNHLPNTLEFEKQFSVPFDGKYLKPGALVNNPNPQMPLIDAICTRRTSRSYSSEIVDRDTLEKLISISMNAPTACNEQQWKIINIQNPKIIQDLYRRGSAAFLQNSLQCFILCYNQDNDNLPWYDHIQSGAAFATTFQLIAHSIGIGSCWICHLPNKGELKRMFNIHSAYEPVCLISYGYYRGKVKIIPRKHNPSHIIMEERFHRENLVFASNRKTLIRRLLRFIYYKMPPFFRSYLRKLSLKYEKKFYYEIYD